MGYADVGEAVAFTDADVAALHRMLHFIEVGNIDPDTANDLVRGLGQTTARLADWQVNTLAGLLERAGTIDVADGLALSTLGEPPTNSTGSCRTWKRCWSMSGGVPWRPRCAEPPPLVGSRRTTLGS